MSFFLRRWPTALKAAVGMSLVVTMGACAPLPRRAFIAARQADYFASKPELSSEVSRAIEEGHVLLGMDTTQVWVALGDPARKTRFSRTQTEVWLYRAGSLHQNHYRLGSEAVRLVFVQNRLVAIEPL